MSVQNLEKHIEKKIVISAPPKVVWENLTKPDLMKQWMGGPEMNLEIITDWVVGKTFVIKGFHHVNFVNKGFVLAYEPCKKLKYDYVSSISRLPEIKENRTVVGFSFSPSKNNTHLILSLKNFPNESIYQHVNFYWNSTLGILKNFIEKNRA